MLKLLPQAAPEKPGLRGWDLIAGDAQEAWQLWWWPSAFAYRVMLKSCRTKADCV